MNVKYMYKPSCIIHVKYVLYTRSFEKYSWRIRTVSYYCKQDVLTGCLQWWYFTTVSNYAQ